MWELMWAFDGKNWSTIIVWRSDYKVTIDKD